MPKPIRVLLLASQGANSLLRLDREARVISKAIREAPDRGAFELASEWAVTASELQHLLSFYKPDIVHFAGNGVENGILLNDDRGDAQVVDNDTLHHVLATVSNFVRVVVLNASGTQRTAKVLSPIIDYTIGMDVNITDVAAVTFAEGFYSALTAGTTVQEAFELAVNRLLLEKQSSKPTLLIRPGVDPNVRLNDERSLSKQPTDASRPSTNLTESPRSAVFVSYSHKDRRWLERLQIHLRPLERDHSFEVWDDTKIQPGTAWKNEIQKALNNAKVAILLVSADFLASDFVAKNELPPLLRAAEQEGALILPIVVSPCRFVRTPLAAFQAVNDPEKPLNALKGADRERILTKVADAVEAALVKQ